MVEKILKNMNMKEIEEFNNICTKCNFEINLKQDRCLVNAKSIMGIFYLDKNKKIKLVAEIDDEDYINKNFSRFIDK